MDKQRWVVESVWEHRVRWEQQGCISQPWDLCAGGLLWFPRPASCQAIKTTRASSPPKKCRFPRAGFVSAAPGREKSHWQMWNVRVHTGDLQEGHNGKEGESSLLIKSEREALMDGAESFKAITGQDGAKDKIKSRVSEQVECFESCLGWDRHSLPWLMSVAVIKLPSKKRLHSNFKSLPTSRATKDPLLHSASLQAHKSKSQTGSICCAATAQTSAGNSVEPDCQHTRLSGIAGWCTGVLACLSKPADVQRAYSSVV